MDTIGWILWRGSKAGARRSLTAASPNDLAHMVGELRPKKKPSAALAHLDYEGG